MPDFSTEELHTYLSDVIGDRWPTIPADVRATLRRPLLARLYRDVASSAIWQPTSEYELYKKFWNRLYTGTQADYPMDADILKRAAYALTQQDENYPWTAAQLSDNATIQRLIKVGWLRSPQLGWYEVWHNRLLNWAVAEGLAHELYHRRLDTAKTCQIIQQLHSSPGLRRPRFLGYVPMDFLWLITEPALGMDDLAVQVLEAMELASRVMSQPDQMYLHLVPTLGPRIAPALFKRLETVAEQNNFVLLDSLVKAIASLEGDQVSMRAAALLDHPSPYVQRAAMQILARKPIAGLLDRLWALHCSRHADPQQFLREHEYPMAAYEDTFSALRSCVVLNPTWLEEAIRRADPAQEPVQDLAYLVASLDDGGEIWKRCKPMLYTKVSTLHERSLANNIGKYRDTEEVAWLLARVHRADDLVGPVALRALIRLDANLALQHLDRLPDWELRATRDWCFAELLAQLPDETLLHFLDRLHQHPNPWELAMVFQGYENAVDTRILEILLNRLAVLLAEEIGQPLPAGRGSRVRLPFLLLLPMARPELLECFRQQRGALLEHNLTTWLLDRGPQQGDWRQHEKCDGLGVLAKIGGPGLTTVVNQWLLAADRYGRMEAMEIAPRRPDTTTIELLRNISQSEELWDNFPVEQGYAAKSLAAAGDWESVIAYLVRWGLQTLIAVTDYRHEAGLLDDRAMTLALHALSSETLPCPGIVLALGFGGRTDCIEWIHKTLDRALADSDVAHACALALDWLRDTDPETVPLLARQLTVPSHRHDAVIALLKNGTDLALDTLLHHLRTAYHHGLAICLLNDHRTVAAVMPLVQQRLYEADDETKLNMIADLLARIRDEDLLDSLLSETAMRDFLRETSFADEGSVWVIGEKIRAIRGLARFDPESASLAAQTALQNVDAHDRELYPYLLVEFERDRAVSLLLEQARHELATSVMWAIARSLAAADYIEPLRALFASPDATRRRTACRLAGRLPSDEWLLAAVRDCLGDADSSVADSAHEALEMLHDGATANALLEALRTETDNTHRWVLLDALWAVGDPGDAQQPWPTWAQRAAVYLSHSMDAYLAEQIKKRRQEVLESARQKDK